MIPRIPLMGFYLLMNRELKEKKMQVVETNLWKSLLISLLFDKFLPVFNRGLTCQSSGIPFRALHMLDMCFTS